MNAFPTDAHLHITVEPRLTRHLSQTIQTAELLELNAEGDCMSIWRRPQRPTP